MRRAIIAGILFVWAGALAALFLRAPSGDDVVQVAPGGVQVTLPDPRAGEGEWWGVYLQGHKIGFVHHLLTYSSDSVSFQEESVLRLTTLGKRQTIRTTSVGELNAAFHLRRLDFSLEAGPTRLRLEAVAERTTLRVAVSPGHETIVLKGPISLPLGLRTAVMKLPLESGRVIRDAVFDPITRTTGLLELKIVGVQALETPAQHAWRIEETYRDIKTTLWVDKRGRLLREEGPMGLVAVRETEADAKRLPSPAAEDWDAVRAVALPVARPIDNPRSRETLRVRLSGIPRDKIPTGGGQTVGKSGVLIERADPTTLRSYSLPYAGPDHAGDLTSTAMIQANHPRILALAKDIIGDERDAVAATKLLVDWVYRYLDKVPTASFPDALAVLDMARGDCNEHAVLLTALARAAGVPARVASGLVYSDGAFLYHAWTQVWLGRWVPVDAAFNQVPADATHVRLLGDDESDQFLMIGMFGNLSIEIVDTRMPEVADPLG